MVRGGGRFDGEEFRRRRQAAGLSQQRVAVLVGSTRRQIIAYERGRTTPEPARLAALAAAVGCPPAVLSGATPEAGLAALRRAAGMTRTLAVARLGETLGGRAPASKWLLERAESGHVPVAWRSAVSRADVVAAMAHVYGVPVDVVVQAWVVPVGVDNAEPPSARPSSRALDVSYHHLSADRRRLLRLLALHPGQGLDAYAAAALTDTDLVTAQTHLHQLRTDHLLQPGSPGRYTFHDLVRAYAAARAHDEDRASDRRAALTRMFDYYLAGAATAMDTLYPAEADRRPSVSRAATPAPDLIDPAAALDWLDNERSTLVAVAAHTAARDWPTHATRLSRTLYRYLNGGHHTDALILHGHAYDAARHSGDVIGQAHALTDVGVAYWRLSRYGPAAEHFQRALALFRQAGDLAGEARTLNNLGLVERRLGHYRTAIDHFTLALTLWEQVGEAHPNVLTNLAILEARLGRHQTATVRFAQALALNRETGDRDGEAVTLNGLGDVELRSGRYELAGDHLRQALALYGQLGNRTGEAGVLDSLGLLLTRLGTPDQATELHQRALTGFRRAGSRYGEVWALNGLGEAATTAGRLADALAHHAAAHTIAADVGEREEQARAHAGLGQAHRILGDRAAAREHYHHALALYTDLEMPDADQIRAHLCTADIPEPDQDA